MFLINRFKDLKQLELVYINYFLFLQSFIDKISLYFKTNLRLKTSTLNMLFLYKTGLKKYKKISFLSYKTSSVHLEICYNIFIT